MRKPLIAGNWKLNGNQALCQDFVDNIKPVAGIDILICPPLVLLGDFEGARFQLGAQDVSIYDSGAYTGEVSAGLLLEKGVSACIVGHSERRCLFAENDGMLAEKIKQLFLKGITPVLCVGEDLQTRDSENAEAFVSSQLEMLSVFSAEQIESMVVAYEPIWAIGTGKTATYEQAQEMHHSVRAKLASYCDAQKVKILYGGSVKPENAEQLLAMPDIDGALVGGASLDVSSFNAIIKAAS